MFAAVSLMASLNDWAYLSVAQDMLQATCACAAYEDFIDWPRDDVVAPPGTQEVIAQPKG